MDLSLNISKIQEVEQLGTDKPVETKGHQSFVKTRNTLIHQQTVGVWKASVAIRTHTVLHLEENTLAEPEPKIQK